LRDVVFLAVIVVAAGMFARGFLGFDKTFEQGDLTMENLIRFLVVFLVNLLVKYQQMLNMVNWLRYGGGGYLE
jgi:hypothetical protein